MVRVMKMVRIMMFREMMTKMVRMMMGIGDKNEKQTPLVKWDDANLIATSFTTSYQHLIL